MTDGQRGSRRGLCRGQRSDCVSAHATASFTGLEEQKISAVEQSMEQMQQELVRLRSELEQTRVKLGWKPTAAEEQLEEKRIREGLAHWAAHRYDGWSPDQVTIRKYLETHDDEPTTAELARLVLGNQAKPSHILPVLKAMEAEGRVYRVRPPGPEQPGARRAKARWTTDRGF